MTESVKGNRYRSSLHIPHAPYYSVKAQSMKNLLRTKTEHRRSIVRRNFRFGLIPHISSKQLPHYARQIRTNWKAQYELPCSELPAEHNPSHKVNPAALN